MSVVVSGTLKTPDGAVVSGANITLTALTVSPDALSGTSASAVTTASGYYGITMEPGEYAVSVSVKGKTSVYGRIRIEGTESSVTLNMLLRRSLVEVSIPDELLVGFRQIQNNVADDLATIRRLNEDSAEKIRQSIQAKDIAVESARHAEESETRIRELALQAQASEHEAGRQAGIAIAAADTSGENARRAEHAMAATEGIAADTANEVARRISQEVKDNARRAEDGATNAEHYASVSKVGAERVATSERKITELADDVSVSLQQTLAATHDAQEARDIAIQKAGEVAAGMADVQENALKISQSLQEVTLARDAAVRAREGAESALAATVQQAGIATQQAEEAGNAVKQATRQAELTATARNEAVSARDETAAFAREVAESVSQINQKVTTATGAAERAEKAADTTTTNAEQAAASAGNAAKDREATQMLTQRAETAAGRAEEIAGAFNLDDASLEKKGIVRLSSATDSDSETEAATPKSVKTAYNLANGKYTAQDGTTTRKGLVQLSSATSSNSETEAATPKAVKAVMDETNRKAPLDSPALTGTPTAPTAEQSVNNTQIATTAFVKAAIAAMVASAPAALDTLNELATALGNDPQFATTMLNALAGKQPLDEQLTAFSQLDATQNTFPYFDSNSQLSLANVSEAARTLLALTSREAMQEHLEIEKYTVSDATTYQKGIVKLSSSLASNSEETAATSKAIASVMKIIYGLQPDPSLIVEILGSGTFNAPELGGLILAAYVGEMGSDLKKTTIKRGDDYPGSALTGVDISMGGKTATGLWIDTLMFGFLPGTYRALSGIGSFE
ncbi:tail fiber protein, partial [Escherichia coli O130:H26]